MSLPGQTLRKIGLDRNPLRRTSDRVEAWVTIFLIITLVVLMPYAAWRAGRASFTAGVRTEQAEQGHRYRTEAVVLPDPDTVTAGDPTRNTGAGPAAHPGYANPGYANPGYANPGGTTGRDTDPAAGQDPEGTVPARGSTAYSRVRAYARWTAADGTEHHGFIAATPPAQPGTRVPVWTDAAGDLTGPPQRRFQTVIDAVTVAALTGAVAIGLLVAVRVLLHRVLEARRLAQWQEAWWQYEPRWTGRRW